MPILTSLKWLNFGMPGCPNVAQFPQIIQGLPFAVLRRKVGTEESKIMCNIRLINHHSKKQ